MLPGGKSRTHVSKVLVTTKVKDVTYNVSKWTSPNWILLRGNWCLLECGRTFTPVHGVWPALCILLYKSENHHSITQKPTILFHYWTTALVAHILYIGGGLSIYLQGSLSLLRTEFNNGRWSYKIPEIMTSRDAVDSVSFKLFSCWIPNSVSDLIK